MKPPIPPTQPDFPKLPHSTWGWLMVLAFLSRMAFLYKTQISFSADEAGGLIHALHFGDPEWKDRLYPAARMLDSMRYWIAIALYRVTHGWLRTGALETICFNLAGCAFWVVWAYRRLSPRAALVTALFLAIPPACMDYYATLLERRQVSFVLGAVLAVVWEKGYSSSRYSFLFGLLLGWGFRRTLSSLPLFQA